MFLSISWGSVTNGETQNAHFKVNLICIKNLEEVSMRFIVQATEPDLGADYQNCLKNHPAGRDQANCPRLSGLIALLLSINLKMEQNRCDRIFLSYFPLFYESNGFEFAKKHAAFGYLNLVILTNLFHFFRWQVKCLD